MTERVKGLIFDIDVDPRTGTAQLRAVSNQFKAAVGDIGSQAQRTEPHLSKLHVTMRQLVTGFGALLVIRQVGNAMRFLAQSGEQMQNSWYQVKKSLGETITAMTGFKDPSSIVALAIVSLIEVVVFAIAAYEALFRGLIEGASKLPYVGAAFSKLASVLGIATREMSREIDDWVKNVGKNAPVMGNMLLKLDKMRKDLLAGRSIAGAPKPAGPEQEVETIWDPPPVEDWVQFGIQLLSAQMKMDELNNGWARMQELIDPITNPAAYDAMFEWFKNAMDALEKLGAKNKAITGMDFEAGADKLTAKMKYQAQAVNMAAEAFGNYAAGMLTAAIAGGEFEGSLGDLLAQLAQQMFAMSLTSLALALFASTPWGAIVGGKAAAADYYAAAAVFGAAGAALAVASRAAGGPSAAPGGEGGGSTSSALKSQERPQEIHVFIEGQGFVQNTEEFARTVGRQISKQASRGGRF